MNLESLAQLGEFAGGIGVILSLIYLAVQVRGNTRSQQADITARVLNRMAAFQHTFGFDAEANAFFIKGINDPTQFNIEERTRFAWLLTEFFSAFEFLLQQYKVGNIDEDTWHRWSKTFDWWLTFPGVRAAYEGRSTPYTQLFTDYIEGRIEADEGHFNRERWDAFLLTGDPNPRPD
jgi:hypothetical protein